MGTWPDLLVLSVNALVTQTSDKFYLFNKLREAPKWMLTENMDVK